MTECRCYSSNEPDDSQVFKCAVRAPGQFGGKFIEIDYCIANDIRRLWENGIWTVGCCCGHGAVHPSVVLAIPDDAGKAESLLGSGWEICYWQDGKFTKVWTEREEFFACGVCPSHLSPKDVKSHMRTHGSEGDVVCNQHPDIKIANIDTFNHHMRIRHAGIDPAAGSGRGG